MGKLIRGSMGKFSLADIVQIIGLGGKTGRLWVEDPARSRCGTLYFENGRIVHAVENGTAGEDAARTLLALNEGEFEFVSGDSCPEKTLQVSGHEMMMRVAQGMDEAAYAGAGGFPAFLNDAEPEPDVGAAREKLREILRARLGRKARRVVAAIDGTDDTLDALMAACEKVETHIALFHDEQLAAEIGREMKEVVGF